jgi:hypothetical protein
VDPTNRYGGADVLWILLMDRGRGAVDPTNQYGGG